MINEIRHSLFSGSINKDFRFDYLYRYKSDNEQYPSVKTTEKGFTIFNGMAFALSEGFEKPHLFLTGKMYFSFVALFHKTLPIIQENVHQLYPNLSEDEFEIDTRTLEIFMTEKAMRTSTGITIYPSKWIDVVNKCYPAIHVDGLYGECNIPLEDAIALDHLLSTFDPLTFGLIMLNMMHS